jgi:hypothetical protein
MMLRLVILALIVLLVLRFAGRLRRLGAGVRKAPRIEAARKCPDCGAYVLASDAEHRCKPAK